MTGAIRAPLFDNRVKEGRFLYSCTGTRSYGHGQKDAVMRSVMRGQRVLPLFLRPTYYGGDACGHVSRMTRTLAMP